MRGLKRIPQESDLLGAYNQLHSSRPVSEKKIVLFSQWTRFDPRLGELLVQHISEGWLYISPIVLNYWIRKTPWPSCLGVILDFCNQKNFLTTASFKSPGSQSTNDSLIRLSSREARAQFLNWRKMALRNVRKSPWQLYFIGLLRPGGNMMKRETENSLNLYLKWGFFASDSLLRSNMKCVEPIAKGRKIIRERAISTLLKRGKAFSVSDYLQLIDSSVSRRQAERDLKNHPGLTAHGFTRNRRFTVKDKKSVG